MRTLPADLTIVDRELPERGAAKRETAWVHMLYIFCNPEDAIARGEALATATALTLDRFRADPESLVAGAAPEALERAKQSMDPATVQEWIEDIAKTSLSMTARELFLPAGGFGAVARAKGTDFVSKGAVKNLLSAIFAGLALCTLYQISKHAAVRGGASMNKVWWLLEKEPPIQGAPRDPSQMKKLWSKYKNVAHLGAAAYLLWERSGNQDDPITLIISRQKQSFLRIAKRFQDFGTNFIPENMQHPAPVLDPELIWRVPINASADDALMPCHLSVPAQLRLLAYRAT
jgi:hypothetical protein